jgi:hypothetical protein
MHLTKPYESIDGVVGDHQPWAAAGPIERRIVSASDWLSYGDSFLSSLNSATPTAVSALILNIAIPN